MQTLFNGKLGVGGVYNPLALFCFTEYSYYMVGYYQN